MRATRAAPFGTRSGGVTATAASCPGTQLASSFGAPAPVLRSSVAPRTIAAVPGFRSTARSVLPAARASGSSTSWVASLALPSSVNGAGIGSA